MMKKLHLLWKVCFGLFVVFLLSHIEDSPKNKSILENDTSSSIGTKDDPDARAEYEWRRLRNPETNRIPKEIRRKELEYTENIPTKEEYRAELKKTNSTESIEELSWMHRGPYNVGGRTRALAVDITD